MTLEEYERYASKNACARRYKIGDKVMIDPDIYECGIGTTVNSEMAEMAGRILSVRDKTERYYTLQYVDCWCITSNWKWQDYMLVDLISDADRKEILSLLE